MVKDHLGADQRKVKDKDEDEKEIKALDEKDIALLKSYGQGQYTKALKVVSTRLFSLSPPIPPTLSQFLPHCLEQFLPHCLNWFLSFLPHCLDDYLPFLPQSVETDIVDIAKRVNELAGIKESDTGLAPPALWDLAADKQSLQSEQPLQVRIQSSLRSSHVFW